MKRTMIVLAVATVFIACNNTGETKATTDSTSVKVDTAKKAVDSAKVDTLK